MKRNDRNTVRLAWACCLCLVLSASSLWAASLEKGPYLLFNGDNTEMVVNWQTDSSPTTSTIEWGETTSYGNGPYAVAEYGDNQFIYTFTGLTPGQKYHYHVDLDGDHQYGDFYAAPPTSQKDLTFWVYGDSRSYPNAQNGVLGWLLDDVDTDVDNHQTIVLHSGDMVNQGTESDWQNHHFARGYPNILETHRRLPMQVARGNHEGSTTLMRKYYPYSYPNGSMNYYSFDYGPVHVCVVDDQATRSVGSTQYNWIAQDLQNTDRTWKIVMWHEPAYGCGTHSNESTNQTLVVNLLEEYGADVVFYGHNHQWCYCYKANGTYPVHHVTTGGGGASLYNVSSSYPYYVYGEKVYSYTRVDIVGCEMTITGYGNSNSGGSPNYIYDIVTAPNGPCSTCGMTVDVTPDGTSSACITNDLSWTANATGATPPISYQWTQDGGDITGATDATLVRNFATAQSHTYNCKVTDGSGDCTDEVDPFDTTGTWTPAPTVDVTPDGTSTVCPGDDIVFSAGISGGTCPYNYQWTEDGSDMGGETGPTLTVNYGSIQSHVYNCRITDSGGCPAVTDVADVTGAWADCVANVEYDPTFDPSATLSQVCGDGDGVVEPGEEWEIRIRLRNVGLAAATAVTADLAVNAGSAVTAVIGGNTGAYGDIGASGSAETMAPYYTFCVDEGAACVSAITFDVVNIQSVEGTYPNNLSAFTVTVGTAAGSETLNQVTDPLQANASSVATDFDIATLPNASSATLSYNTAYASCGPTEVTPPFTDAFGSQQNPPWTGNPTNWNDFDDQIGCHTTAPNVELDSSDTVTGTFCISGYTNLTMTCDWFVENNLDSGEYFYGEYRIDGGAWTPWFTSPEGGFGSDTWTCGETVAIPATGDTLEVRFVSDASQTSEDGRIDNFSLTGTLSGGGWDDDVRVEFWDLSGWQILKDYGVADANPYDVTAFYNGPGTYRVRITEQGGGDAEMTAGALALVSTDECEVASCGCNCVAPSGLNAPATADEDGNCASGGGVRITWDQDPADWGDGGSGTRTYDVLRDGGDLQTGIAYGTATWLDATAAAGTAYDYSVRYNNGCGESAVTGQTAGTDADGSVGVPVITAVEDWDGTCSIRITYTEGSAADTHDLWVDGAEVAADVPNPCTYTPGDAASHDFQIQANNACGSELSAITAGSDADCAGDPPGEVGPGSSSANAIGWTDVTTVIWPAEADATSYILYRGVLADLPAVLDAADDSCTKYSGSALSAAENDDPTAVAGRFYFYVVIGENAWGQGPAGNATAGPRVMNSTGACP